MLLSCFRERMPAHESESTQDSWFRLQLDPTKEEVFDILGKIYAEFFDMFGFDSFHMGGKNVKSACWKTSPDILAYMDSDPELSAKDDNGKSYSEKTREVTSFLKIFCLLMPCSCCALTRGL